MNEQFANIHENKDNGKAVAKRYLVKFALCLLFLAPVVLFMSIGFRAISELLSASAWYTGYSIDARLFWGMFFEDLQLDPSRHIQSIAVLSVGGALVAVIAAAIAASVRGELTLGYRILASGVGPILSMPLSGFIIGWMVVSQRKYAAWIVFLCFLLTSVALFTAALSLMACFDKKRWHLWKPVPLEVGEPVPYAQFRKEEES